MNPGGGRVNPVDLLLAGRARARASWPRTPATFTAVASHTSPIAISAVTQPDAALGQ